MKSLYYDKDGTPISDVLFWAKKYEALGYKRVAETTLSDGKWVSTVWLGIDHSFRDDGPPIIFETMVFQSYEPLGSELETKRYSTLGEAKAGHAAMVARWERRALKVRQVLPGAEKLPTDTPSRVHNLRPGKDRTKG